MDGNRSIQFFDAQFRRQVAAGDYALNPFEAAALPHLHGAVLDYGCGLGNLAVQAARRGTTFMEMFSPESHCLLDSGELQERFAGWEMIGFEQQAFPAPGDTRKRFATLIARKPADPVAPPATPRT